MATQETWNAFAEKAGFRSERDMWETLYAKHGMAQLAEQLNVSVGVVRSRLHLHGIKIRSRGGPRFVLENHGMSEELLERIRNEGIEPVSRSMGLSKYALMRRRRKFLDAKAEQELQSGSSTQDPSDPAPQEDQG